MVNFIILILENLKKMNADVVSGAPGRCRAAISATELGLKMVLIEKDRVREGRLNWGCVSPTRPPYDYGKRCKFLVKRFKIFAVVMVLMMSAFAETMTKQKIIVVSISPLHSLVANLVEGIDEVVLRLLVDPKQSAHHLTLRPSQSQLLNEASMIVVVGPTYEVSLWPQLQSFQHKVIAMDDTPGLHKKKIRFHGGCLHNHPSEGGHNRLKPEDETHNIDGHFWLMPYNAKKFCTFIAHKLKSFLDNKQDQIKLEMNKEKVHAMIDETSHQVRMLLKQRPNISYWLYHDFMNYFDDSFKTQTKGILTLEVGHPLSPSIVQRLNTEQSGTVIYLEPQFDPPALREFCQSANLSVKTLDYLGFFISPGPKAYNEIMVGLAKILIQGQ